MNDVLAQARVLRDRLAADAGVAKDRAEYLRTVALWNDAVRLVDGLEAIMSNPNETESNRLEAAETVLVLHKLATDAQNQA